jgi:transcriptional regulator with PAS, ATPase and Fis domain
LAALVEKGQFREDLYYRLNVVQIKLPSLSEREDDIPLLVQHFVQKYSQQMNKLVRGVDNQAMYALINYHWKGEIRELENAIERALIFVNSDMITLSDLPENVRRSTFNDSDTSIQSLDEALKIFEKKYITKVLKLYDYDKDIVAKILNISTSTLYRRMQEFDIEFK